MKQRTVRIVASIGALVSTVGALFSWGWVGFQDNYFPEQSLKPLYAQIVGWGLASIYFVVVAYFMCWNPKHWKTQRAEHR
jgi:hypothetical protein